MKNLRRILLAVAFLAVAAGLFLEWRERPRRRLPRDTKPLACPSGPLFSRPPIAPEALAAVVPLGHVVPPAHVFPTSQLNLYLRRNNHAVVVPAPIVAPGPLRITSVARKEQLGANDRPIAVDYTLYYQVCEGVVGQFMLVQSLAPELARDIGDFEDARCDTYETGGARFRFCSKEMLIAIEDGAPLGVAGNPGPEGNRGEVRGVDLIDWGLRDRRREPLVRANPGRRREPDFDHTVCPLDALADSPARAAMLEKIGLPDGARRTASPPCGLASQDHPGTAQGAWYRPGSPDLPEDEHLALIRDAIDPARGAFSIGRAFAPLVEPQKILFAPDADAAAPRNRDFAALRPGDTACYDHLDGTGPRPFRGTIHLTLETDARLRVRVDEAAADCAAAPAPDRTREIVFVR